MEKIFVRSVVLMKKARENGDLSDWINQLDPSNLDDSIIEKAKERTFEVLRLCKGEKRYDDQSSLEFIHQGIQNIYRIMENNQPITGAPLDPQIRKNFFKKLAKGYLRLGENIKEELNQNRMDEQDLYSCLETIGEGGHACAGRWRNVLEELLRSFSLKRSQENLIINNPHTNLDEQLKRIFQRARVIEGNRAAEEFVSRFFPKMGESTRSHVVAFFKRATNVFLDYHLPITMDQDDFLGKRQDIYAKYVEDYLEMMDLNKAVIDRVEALFQEKIQGNHELFNQVVDYHGWVYRTKYQNQFEDVSEFLSEKIFDGYSRNMKKEAFVEMLQDKHFIEYQKKEIDLEKIIQNGLNTNTIKMLAHFLQGLSKEGIHSSQIKPFLDLKSKSNRTLLQIATKKNMIPFTKFLIKSGANIEVKDIQGDTPLMICADKGHLKIAELLVEAGANVNVKNNFDRSILFTAVFENHTELSKFLIDRGANTMALNKYGNTPLMASSSNGNVELSKYLIENGSDIHIFDKQENNALIYAVMYRHRDMIAFLIEQGAELSGKMGRKALKAARGDRDIWEMVNRAQKEQLKEAMNRKESKGSRNCLSIFNGLGFS